MNLQDWQRRMLKSRGINPDAVQRILDAPKPAGPPAYGEVTRGKCSAPARSLGEWGDRTLVLFVSAMDNSLCIDEWDPYGEPVTTKVPLPSNDSLAAASGALSWARTHKWHEAPAGGGQ